MYTCRVQVHGAEKLPKDDEVLPSLLQLMWLGLTARRQIAEAREAGHYRLPKPEEVGVCVCVCVCVGCVYHLSDPTPVVVRV
jgi:hypothetical protein